MARGAVGRWFGRINWLAVALALGVVVLGAYVRLSDAGLGCPDWPGCYGEILGVPGEEQRLDVARQHYGDEVPAHRLDPAAGWKEMVHRYFASTLGLLIVVMAVLAWRRRREPEQPVVLPVVLVGLVVFQGLLGMWTVTLQLKPVIVMAHLLGGLATLALLWWLVVARGRWVGAMAGPRLRGLLPWSVAGTAILAGQIALGGWTSANYAALACPDFPTCQGEWWPPMDFREAFVLWRGLGVNYEFGVLDHPARTAIQVSHRIGALVTALYLGVLGLVALLRGRGKARLPGAAVLVLLAVQVALGISNVLLGLPLPVAVAHNGVAALLLLSVLTLAAAALRSGASVKQTGVNNVIHQNAALQQ